MNSQTIKSQAVTRIAWKEIRSQLALFAILIVGAIGFQLLVQLLLPSHSVDSMTRAARYGLLGAFASLFAATCGAMMFSSETENDTKKILQVLPISSNQVMFGKIIGGGFLAACFLTITLLTLVIMFASGGLKVWMLNFSNVRLFDSPRWLLYFAIALTAVEFFCWGWLCSLLFKRTLVAIVASCLLPSLAVGLLASRYLQPGSGFDAFSIQPYLMIWPMRVGVLAILMITNVWLSINWLDGRQLSASWASTKTNLMSASGRFSLHNFARLTWQTARQSRWALIALFTVTAFGLFALWNSFRTDSMGVFLTICGSFLVVASIAGLATFNSDQVRNKFRFFTEHGERPATIWLSRISVWLTATLICCAALLLVCYSLVAGVGIPESVTSAGRHDHVVYRPAHYWFSQIGFGYVLCTLTCFAVGAWCSLNIRSFMISLVVNIIVSLVLVGWIFAVFAGQIPLWWSALPIPICLLLSGFLRTKHWLAERHSLRAWMISAAVILLPFGCVFYGMTWFRANEIPLVENELLETSETNVAYAEEIQKEFKQLYSLYQPDEDFVLEIDGKTSSSELTPQQLESIDRLLEKNETFLKQGRELVTKTISPDSYTKIGQTAVPIIHTNYRPELSKEDRDQLWSEQKSLPKVLHWDARRKLIGDDPNSAFDAMITYWQYSILDSLDHTRVDDPYDSLDFAWFEQWLNMDSHDQSTFMYGIEKLEHELHWYRFDERTLRIAHRRNHQSLERPDLPKSLSESYKLIGLLPWEKKRHQRLVDYALSYSMDSPRHTKNYIEKDAKYSRWLWTSVYSFQDLRFNLIPNEDRFWFFGYNRLYQSSPGQNRLPELAIRLVLEKIKSGNYPDTLISNEEFVSLSRSYLPQRFSNFDEPFAYYPNGLHAPVTRLNSFTGEYEQLTKPGQPFIAIGPVSIQYVSDDDRLPVGAVIGEYKGNKPRNGSVPRIYSKYLTSENILITLPDLNNESSAESDED